MIFVWIGFILFILGMLAIDLGVFHRKSEVISAKQALRWTGICAVLAILFGLVVYYLYEHHYFGLGLDPRFPSTGREAALQYITGWLVEQSLSLDNVFVIAVIFAFFKIPPQYQHRVLFWGIIGALVMRGIVIAAGAAIIHKFWWAHYLFGGMLIYAAAKMALLKEGSFNPSESIVYRLAVRFYPVSDHLDGQKFFTVVDGKRALTPMFLVLLLIESTDVLFAVDSIPAVFAITEDPFLVFTSNIFAILNLRSLYFALAAMVGRFHHLKTALLFVLAFVGIKLVLTHHWKINTELSFLIILLMLLAGIVASILIPPKKDKGNIFHNS